MKMKASQRKQSVDIKTLIYLLDLNEIICNDLKCDDFVLNGLKNERSEFILEVINRIYDLLFDFLYEAQLKIIEIKHKHNHGFGGKLSSDILSPIFSEIDLNKEGLSKIANVLNVENILNTNYNRDQFNLLFRLISMHQNNINESFMSYMDYQTSIVKLPNISIPNGFLTYLQNRFPNWNKRKFHANLSQTSTQVSNQYDLGPPKSKKQSANNSQQISVALHTMYEGKEYIHKIHKHHSKSPSSSNTSSQQDGTQYTMSQNVDRLVIYIHSYVFAANLRSVFFPQYFVYDIFQKTKKQKKRVKILYNTASC